MATEISSSESHLVKKHDVFISFRGEDTRANFTSHLHEALKRSSIQTYIDYNIKKGKQVWGELEEAILNSNLFLVVLSENYASSTWCLDELVEIMKCSKNGQVVPVFYCVDPSHVRKQTGSYQTALATHKKKHGKDMIQKWKNALSQVANLSGFHSSTYKTETELIEDIIKAVLGKLNHKYTNELRGQFIADQNFSHIESLMKVDSREVRIIGIWGMGGIGKTTLAAAVFQKLSSKYESSCFLENVREESKRQGLNNMCSKLLSKLLSENVDIGTSKVIPSWVLRRLKGMKVLIVLDDVHTSELLESLIGEGCKWLGDGSKVIVTSRDKQVLEHIPIEEVFEQLKCSKQGLTSEEGANRLQTFGPNKLEEKKENKLLKFLGFMWNPLSWVMEVAAIMCIVLANGGGRPPNWQDFVGIIALLLINSTISFIEENNAGNAAAALMAGLALKTKVLRDGKWSEQDAGVLVPGDIINIKLGDIIPADIRLLEGDPLSIDQSALTGESLPVTKNPTEVVFSGSTVKKGEIEAIVFATGVNSFFGKAAHLVDSTNQVGHFQSVLTAIGNFCICSIGVGIFIELIVMNLIQHRKYRDVIDNLLVLLIGGIPISMPTVLSVIMAIGSHRLAQQGAITKRMTAIEEMAGMDVLCSDKTGTLTLNKLSVDINMVEVFAKGVKKEDVILQAARASRTENQDAIDAAIVGMLSDPNEARAGIDEVHFLPFNPVDKRTALTYIDSGGNWHRASKGAPEQILDLCNCKEGMRKKVHAVIDNFADRGLRSLGVASQEVPEKSKDSPGGLWQFVGLLPLFDPPRHDSAETIKRAINLGVNVKMITGDQLAIGKETGRRLGMGTNMYPSSVLLGQGNDASTSNISVDELIEMADGFAGVFPEHKYDIVKRLQEKKHICGMTGDGVNDAPALKKADIGIAVADATDAARSASDIVLTEPGLSVIISAVLTSRSIFQRMKNYTIYDVSITIRIVFGFMCISLIWRFDFAPFMVLIIVILNNGTIMTISKDRVKPSPLPDSWKLKEIFATGVVLGGYMGLMSIIFFWLMIDTDFFSDKFGVKSLRYSPEEMMAALYLQVSIISQALIFVTRSRDWSFFERPGVLLLSSFLIAQLVATFIAVYANWGFARIEGMGWGWAGVIWLYSLVTYVPLDLLKFAIRYIMRGKALNNLSENKTAITTKKDSGKEEREAQWETTQRTVHDLQPPDASSSVNEGTSSTKHTELAEEARKRAEIERLWEQNTLKARVESIVKKKGLDVDTINMNNSI